MIDSINMKAQRVVLAFILVLLSLLRLTFDDNNDDDDVVFTATTPTDNGYRRYI